MTARAQWLAVVALVAAGCAVPCAAPVEVEPVPTLLVTDVMTVGDTAVIVTARVLNTTATSQLKSKSGEEVITLPSGDPALTLLRIGANDEVWLQDGEVTGNRLTVRDQQVELERPSLGLYRVDPKTLWLVGPSSTQPVRFVNGREREVTVACGEPSAPWLRDFVSVCSLADYRMSKVRAVVDTATGQQRTKLLTIQ
ncbi:MAG: hypothetical protein U0228_13075 [Myxococcaceae bacterium]